MMEADESCTPNIVDDNYNILNIRKEKKIDGGSNRRPLALLHNSGSALAHYSTAPA